MTFFLGRIKKERVPHKIRQRVVLFRLFLIGWFLLFGVVYIWIFYYNYCYVIICYFLYFFSFWIALDDFRGSIKNSLFKSKVEIKLMYTLLSSYLTLPHSINVHSTFFIPYFTSLHNSTYFSFSHFLTKTFIFFLSLYN